MQGPEGSSRIFAETWRIFKDPCRDLKDPCRDLARTSKILERSSKILQEIDEDLTRSSSGSTKILMKIFKDLVKFFTRAATGEIRTVHDHIDCNSKNLIYMIHCLRCNKQYIGEKKRRLKDRFNEH